MFLCPHKKNQVSYLVLELVIVVVVIAVVLLVVVVIIDANNLDAHETLRSHFSNPILN